MNFKDIQLGELIKRRVFEIGMDISRVCNFMDCTEAEVLEIYKSKDLGTNTLLRLCKLLEYDFFRIYSQHLILYAPVSKLNKSENLKTEKSKLPQFRKNIYTREVIFFILELIETKEKTILQIISDYNIPKTTLYKWIRKYRK